MQPPDRTKQNNFKYYTIIYSYQNNLSTNRSNHFLRHPTKYEGKIQQFLGQDNDLRYDSINKNKKKTYNIHSTYKIMYEIPKIMNH